MVTTFLHERLTRSLLEEMASGVYREGQLFLSMRTISRLWKVSEPTVASSMRALTEAGLIRSSPRRGFILSHGFQQKAQVLLRRNRTAALEPPLSLQQKMRLLQNTSGGKIAMLLETSSTASAHNTAAAYIPESELRRAACSFEQEGRRYGFLCHWFSYTNETAGAIREELEAGEFAGAVVYCRSSHEMIQTTLEPLFARQLPVVVIYDDCSGMPVSSINLNNVGLAYDAIRQLYRMGHRRIAMLMRNAPLKVHTARLKGCLLAHAEGGCGDAVLEIVRLAPRKPLSAAVRNIFADAARRPTAVFSSESRLLRTLSPLWAELGISVPEDISVIMASSRQGVTGLKCSIDAMQLKVGARIGRLAAQLLHRLQAGQALERSVLLDVNYVRRGSVLRRMVPAKVGEPHSRALKEPTVVSGTPVRKRRMRKKTA